MVLIKLFFRDDFDINGVEEIVESFGDAADLDTGLKIAYYSGEAERGQEFVRAIETVELPVGCIVHNS